MRRRFLGIFFAFAVIFIAGSCATQEEIDARCLRDLKQMRAGEKASERYYAEISAVVVGLSDDLDRESARTSADKQAAEVASAVGDNAAAATYASDAAEHEERLSAINRMLDDPLPPFPETSRVPPEEQDWMSTHECGNAERMRRIGLASMIPRRRARDSLVDARLPDSPSDSSACELGAASPTPPDGAEPNP